MSNYTFALISETPLVSAQELFMLRGALEVNASHCAASWRCQRPAIDVIDDRTKLPPGCRPVVFVESSRNDGILAQHYWDHVEDGPSCVVYVEGKSSLNQGKDSIAEAAAHEILEAMVNPRLNLWIDHPTRAACQIAAEVCDPVQDSYRITAMGSEWQVANFVTPQYFDPRFNDPDKLKALQDAGGCLDFCHRLRAPGTLGPEGYFVLRSYSAEHGWKRWQEDGWGEVSQPRASSWRSRELLRSASPSHA